MKDTVAYAIAAAVEVKTGLRINLQSDKNVWRWKVFDVDESSAVLKTTSMAPQHVAQICMDTFRHLIPKNTRKRKDTDD